MVGLSSDAPNVMVGKDSGVGVLLCEKLGHFIRHDTCELHASANLLKTIEMVWPMQMNIPSVTQFCYLSWYILNSDWDLFKSILKLEILREEGQNEIHTVIDRIEG